MKNVKIFAMAILAGLALVACTPKKESLTPRQKEAYQALNERLRAKHEIKKEIEEAKPVATLQQKEIQQQPELRRSVDVSKKEQLLRDFEDACNEGDLTAAFRVISEMEREYGIDGIDSVYSLESEKVRFEIAADILQLKFREKESEQIVKLINALDDDEEDE